MSNKERILDVKDLRISFHTYGGEVQAVRGVEFYLDKGETLAIVGESGCGKTVTSKSLMRLLPEDSTAEIKSGSQIKFGEHEITSKTEKEMRNFRGEEISMIFQDPMTSLNPTMTCGKQIAENLLIHKDMNKKEAMEEAIKMLGLVNIPNPEKRAKQYPHEMSGGMRQRVMIALALACKPKILIADEPTTALDVTIQAQIMDLIAEIQEKTGTAVILVTHDLGVVADVADRILVMYAGVVIEQGTVNEIFYEPSHPYTWALLKSVPSVDSDVKEELYSLGGTPPDLIKPPVGCPFAARCDYCMEICKEAMPEKTLLENGHYVKCWLKHPYAPEVEVPKFGSKEMSK